MGVNRVSSRPKPVRTFEPLAHSLVVDEHRTYIPIRVNHKTLAWNVETEMYSVPLEVTENVCGPDSHLELVAILEP